MIRVVVIVLLISLLAGCGGNGRAPRVEAAKAPDPIVVRVAVAETRAVERSISITGELQADETGTVSAEVAGRVTSIRTDFGQRVRKGDIIAVLDQHEYRIAVERSRAALAQALARIGLDSNQLEVTPETTPAIRQATAQMEDARSRYESAAKLVKTGDIANERYIELENAYRTRQAALDAALDELRTQLAGVQGIRAELKLAEKRLADTIVRAPFDGGVSERNVAPGQYIAANTPIVTLVKSWPLRLRVDVPESAAASVRPGTSLVFSTDAAPGVEFRALVKQLNPSLDAKARSLTAEARLAQADARLKPGMFVQVRLITAADQQIVTVPREALFTVAGLTKVYVISAGQAKERRFTPGLERDGWVEVPGGTVKPGEHVAISNLQNLAEGVAVKPTPPRKG